MTTHRFKRIIDFGGHFLRLHHGLPPRSERTTTPDLIRAVIARELKLYEERAILIDVDANLPLLTVTASLVTPGRVDCVIPTEVIPGLILLGGDVRQLS